MKKRKNNNVVVTYAEFDGPRLFGVIAVSLRSTTSKSFFFQKNNNNNNNNNNNDSVHLLLDSTLLDSYRSHANTTRQQI